jgi:hypothetical protein
MSRSLIFLCPCWLFLFPLEDPLEEMDDHDGEGRPDERGDQRNTRCWDLEVLIPVRGTMAFGSCIAPYKKMMGTLN